jgi:uncharacterized LabA/DUF88 family protein
MMTSSIAKSFPQRIGVFVDVQNMFYSAYDCFRGRLNYKRLLDYVTGGRWLVRAVAYAMRDGNNQNPFFTMLREVGFELRTKEPRVRPDGSRKGGWDIGIAVEAITVAPKLDVIALVSGDGDFIDLVKALQARGVRVEVYAFERSVGRELREAADLFMPITEDLIFREAHAEGEAPPEPPRSPASRPTTFGAGILTDETPGKVEFQEAEDLIENDELDEEDDEVR